MGNVVDRNTLFQALNAQNHLQILSQQARDSKVLQVEFQSEDQKIAEDEKNDFIAESESILQSYCRKWNFFGRSEQLLQSTAHTHELAAITPKQDKKGKWTTSATDEVKEFDKACLDLLQKKSNTNFQEIKNQFLVQPNSRVLRA